MKQIASPVQVKHWLQVKNKHGNLATILMVVGASILQGMVSRGNVQYSTQENRLYV